jgi:uncharacterized membrane protein YdbT with pleckstrin-like domain
MDENQSILELQVDQSASRSLSDAAKWARFLSIVGFVGMGLLILCLLLARAAISTTMTQFAPTMALEESYGIVVAIIVIIVAIVGLLMYLLFRGATLIKRGIETKSQETFNNGLSSLKIYFAIYGVFAVVGVIANLIAVF